MPDTDHKKVMDALNEYFKDTSRSQLETAVGLEMVKDEIEIMLESLEIEDAQ